MKTNDGQKVPNTNFMKKMVNSGELNRDTKFDNSMEFETSPTKNNAVIEGMNSWEKNVNLDDPGFEADGTSFFKHGTPYGEAAYFNQLPPGPDIGDQKYALINNMPLKMITMMGYPGDGGFPVRDIPELTNAERNKQRG
jgi:hypothetical protein